MSKEILVDYKKATVLRQEHLVLKEVDFQLYTGEFVYFIGKVGSGKSSLIKTMYADIPVEAEQADVLGYDVRKLKLKQIAMLRRKIGIVFQDFQLLTDRSVYDNLLFVLKATGWIAKQDMDKRIDEVLKQVGMQKKTYKMPHELSGGEQQRIVIARALLNHPDIILADEPTGNLDPETAQQIVLLLHTISQQGTAIIMTTHNLGFIDEYPARTMRCENKKLVEVAANSAINSSEPTC